MTFEELSIQLEEYVRSHSSQRTGQAYFNALSSIRPDLANEVRCTPADPFHNDDNLPNFCNYIAGRLA
jgi:hypothetical protein